MRELLVGLVLCSQRTRFYPTEGAKEKDAVLAVLNSKDLVEQIGHFFYESTQKYIVSESYTLVGGKTSGVDLVRQVLRVVPICWVATDLVSLLSSIVDFCVFTDELVQGGIQLKTKDHPHGSYTPAELFDILGDIYS